MRNDCAQAQNQDTWLRRCVLGLRVVLGMMVLLLGLLVGWWMKCFVREWFFVMPLGVVVVVCGWLYGIFQCLDCPREIMRDRAGMLSLCYAMIAGAVFMLVTGGRWNLSALMAYVVVGGCLAGFWTVWLLFLMRLAVWVNDGFSAWIIIGLLTAPLAWGGIWYWFSLSGNDWKMFDVTLAIFPVCAIFHAFVLTSLSGRVSGKRMENAE